MNTKATKQQWLVPMVTVTCRIVANTLGIPGLVGEPAAGLFVKEGI